MTTTRHRFASFGRMEDPDEDAAAQLREGRVTVARANGKWTELPETSLVRSGPSWLVLAETDELYTPIRGVVFAPGSVSIVCDVQPLTYYVSAADEVVFVEKSAHPRTWSEVVERQARRGRKVAP